MRVSTRQRQAAARPLLRWAGGKTQLLLELMPRVPSEYRRYFEPFFGGGALYFALCQKRQFESVLGDVNEELIGMYRHVRDYPMAIINLLRQYQDSKEEYYRIRSLKPRFGIERSARFIYLNKICWNGLYRVNQKGEFNVPYGRSQNGKRRELADASNIMAVSEILRGAILTDKDYWVALEDAGEEDFVYIDPPYYPLPRETRKFEGYTPDLFMEEDHKLLRDRFVDLSQRGVHVMLSNADTPGVWKLYKDVARHIIRVKASRMINSRASERLGATEVIILNYDPPEA